MQKPAGTATSGPHDVRPTDAPSDRTAFMTEPRPYAGHDLLETDPVLGAALEGVADDAAGGALHALGRWWGSAEAEEVARLATGHPPVLHAYDLAGDRLDEVEHHPAYHALLNRSTAAGLASSAWEEDPSGARRQHRLRAAALYLAAQTEPVHLDALSLTHAGIAALAAAPDLEGELFPSLASRRYDRRVLPVSEKDGASLTLALAEREAGTDLSAVATLAEPAGEGIFALSGRKWFVSAPMADVWIALARTEEGPGCFLMPRVLPDGTLNRIHLLRLKRTHGSNIVAIAEAELAAADGVLVGEPGRGLAAIRDTLTLLRLDGAIRAAGLMRAVAARAAHHARTRTVAGRALADEPLMQRVLADIALDAAAATSLVLRVAAAYDQAFESDGEFALARLLTPVAKFFTAKVAPHAAAEAAEAVGGNALVAPHPLARALADAPSLQLWAGTGNELALETARLVTRNPRLLEDTLDVLAADLGGNGPARREEIERVADLSGRDPAAARLLAERLALFAAAAAMRRDLPRVVSDAFLRTRLDGAMRTTYGALDVRFDPAALIDFVLPET